MNHHISTNPLLQQVAKISFASQYETIEKIVLEKAKHLNWSKEKSVRSFVNEYAPDTITSDEIAELTYEEKVTLLVLACQSRGVEVMKRIIN